MVRPNGEYQRRVNLGDPIGPGIDLALGDGGNTSTHAFGTFGFYVDVKTQSSSWWTRYGVTNYYAIRACFDGFALEVRTEEDGSVRYKPGNSTPKTDCHDADQNGVTPNWPLHRLEMESPPRRIHNLDAYCLKARVNCYRNLGSDATPGCINDRDQCQAELDRKLAFFDKGKHTLAPPWAASGHGRWSAGNQRLEWALVRVPESRQGSNVLPDMFTWAVRCPNGAMPTWEGCDVPLKQNPCRSVRNLKPGDVVYWRGARTGCSVGVFHKFKSMVWSGNEKNMNLEPSEEYTVISYGRGDDDNFTCYGNTGAAVWNASGEVLGLFSLSKPPNLACGQGYALITPIEDVLADIKAFSGREITGIRKITQDV